MNLLPCPFCGNSKHLREADTAIARIVCDHCQAEGPTAGTGEDACGYWNDRGQNQPTGRRYKSVKSLMKGERTSKKVRKLYDSLPKV